VREPAPAARHPAAGESTASRHPAAGESTAAAEATATATTATAESAAATASAATIGKGRRDEGERQNEQHEPSADTVCHR
jgi:hypothetical protein